MQHSNISFEILKEKYFLILIDASVAKRQNNILSLVDNNRSFCTKKLNFSHEKKSFSLLF